MQTWQCQTLKCDKLIKIPHFLRDEYICKITKKAPYEEPCPLGKEITDMKEGNYVVISCVESEYGHYMTTEYDSEDKAREEFDENETAALLLIIARKGEKEFPEV